MQKKKGNISDLILRYLILVLVAIPNLWLFYLVFTPLTSYPVYWLLNIFYDASLLNNNVVLLNQAISIELIEACIAGSAYYLLLILNLSTPGIKTGKRIKIIAISFLIFLVVNIIRIFILSFMALSGSDFFGITHQIFWYTLSTIFVVAIWFLMVKA